MVFNKSSLNKSLNKPSSKPMNRSFVTVDCDLKAKTNFDYQDLISPAAVLNEKEICNSLDFFSTKAPKKKSNLKRVSADDVKSKRKRLENYFSSIDLDSWSERNFTKGGEDWHDDLHFVVLKQQERSRFMHQLWLFVMFALLCLMLISIAGIVYSKNHANADSANSHEFIQKFISDFNHTESKSSPDPANAYSIGKPNESNESWLEHEAKYWRTLLGARENESLNLTKKATSKKTRSVEQTDQEKIRVVDHSNLNQVDYELVADESVAGKLGEKLEDSFDRLVNKANLKSIFKQFQDIF